MTAITTSETVNPDHPFHYVSAIDGPRKYVLAGPYDSHEEACANVRAVTDIAIEGNPKAHWMAWGTCSAADVIDTPLGAI